MNTYRIKIKGRNYLLDFSGEPHKMGFTTTRIVRASTEDEAEKAVRRQISCHPQLVQEALNGKQDPPRVEIDSIKRRWFGRLFSRASSGLAFFPEDAE